MEGEEESGGALVPADKAKVSRERASMRGECAPHHSAVARKLSVEPRYIGCEVTLKGNDSTLWSIKIPCLPVRSVSSRSPAR